MIKKVIKTLLTLGLPFGLYVGGVLLWGTIFNYSPEEFTPLYSSGTAHETPDSTFTFVTWNIGFTGLGEETDFFYDGGKTVIQTPELVTKNRNGISSFIAAQTECRLLLPSRSG